MLKHGLPKATPGPDSHSTGPYRTVIVYGRSVTGLEQAGEGQHEMKLEPEGERCPPMAANAQIKQVPIRRKLAEALA